MNTKLVTAQLILSLLLLLGPPSRAMAGDQVQSCKDLTADWPLWSSLSKHPWTQKDIRERNYFPLTQVLLALKTVPLSATLEPAIGNDDENYEEAKNSQPGYSSYAVAADVYRKGDLAKAILLFDDIVADRKSHFRAAAAYSAARAAIRLSRLGEAIQRINSIVRDPALKEFHYQTYDLLSKMRYKYEAAALNAAELEEATHILTAPTAAVCGDPVGEKLRQKFGDEIGELIVSWPDAKSVRRIATSAMSPLDPLLSVADAITNSRYMQHSRFSGGEYTWEEKETISRNLTSFRANWVATRNPLWAVALLENSNDESDLSVVYPAIKVLHQWPKLSEPGAARYSWRLVAQAVRIELMRGNLDKAASFSRLLTKADMHQAHKQIPQPDIAGADDIITTDGIRWFIHHYDHANARRWALLSHQAYGFTIPPDTRPILAENFSELYGDGVFSLKKNNGIAELGSMQPMLDLLRGSELIKLSHLPQVSRDDKKTMVGAAWSRAYALQHWNDVFIWLPDIKAAFPELKEEAQEIETVHTQTEKRHLATHLLGSAPGLLVLPSWSRSSDSSSHFSTIGLTRKQNIKSFDTENRNDGNWWCEPDPKQIEANAINRIMDMAAEWNPIPGFPAEIYEQPAAESQMEKVISTFPILKAIDLKELQSLESIGSASKRLAADADEWATSPQNDSRD